MKLLLAIVLLLSALLTTARAQQDADGRYITIYGVIQQADTDLNNGQSADALATYKDAQSQLLKFQQIYPDWQTDIVSYRLSDLAGKIAALQAQIPGQNNAASNSTAANAPVSSSPAVSTTVAPANVPDNSLAMNVLQSQLQSLKDQNSQLQAKLHEALSSQPQMVDASELTKADDQIRALMKENDLLRASVPATAAVPAAPGTTVSQLQAQLAETTQKLAFEHDRADKLARENATLQLALANSGKQISNSSNSLSDENDRLKSQLDSMQAAAQQTANNSATTTSESAAQLAAAKSQIASLESAVMLANLEKTALEDRLNQARTGLGQANANVPVSGTTTANIYANSTPTPAPTPVVQPTVTPVAEAPAPEPTPAPQPVPAPQPAPVADTAPVPQPTPVAPVEPATPVAEPTPAPQPVVAEQPAPVAPAVPVAAPTPVAQAAPAPAPAPAPVAAPETEPSPKSAPQWPAGTAELVASAQQHYSNHEYNLAEDDYQKILEHDENNGLALANLALIEMQENKLAKADKDIKAALAQSPNDSYNLAMLGKIEFAENDFDDALTALTSSARLEPNNPETQNYLGLTYSHKNMRAQAETAFRKAIQIDPNYAPAHNNIAVIYLTQNPPMPQLARWHYQKALESGGSRNSDLEKLLASKGAPVTSAQQ